MAAGRHSWRVKWFRWLPWLLLPLLALLLLRALRPAERVAVEKIGHQDAAEPLSLAQGEVADPRFHEISPWDRVSVPVIDPAEAEGLLDEAEARRALVENAPGRASAHAAADGWVLLADAGTEGRGGVVLLAHRLADDALRFSLYRPLSGLRVSPGMLVGRGTRLASSVDSGESGEAPPASPLTILREGPAEPWQRLEIGGAEHMPGLGKGAEAPDD
jgi:hypothetical protein